MNSLSKQRGITLVGFIVVLAVLGVFVYVGMRLFPLYAEYYTVVGAMKKVAARPGVAQMPPDRIRYEFLKQFEIDPAYYFESYVKKTPTAIKITRAQGYTLTIVYERPTHLMYNLDVVAKFEKSIDLLRQGADD